MQDWYKDWFDSPYYHLLYSHRDQDEAADFIDRLIAHLRPDSASRMLDVACGKGRHAMQLASKGFDVTGIDLSEASICEAKRLENEKLHFFVHDMRLPSWINYFDYVFNFFTSFGYFETMREHDAAMRSMTGALRRGGLLVIDYLNVSYAETHLKPEASEEKGNFLFEIKRNSDEHHFIKEIRVTNKETEESLTYFEKVAKFRKAELSRMLAIRGMEVIEVFGDYFLGSYDESLSPRLILIARKSA